MVVNYSPDRDKNKTGLICTRKGMGYIRTQIVMYGVAIYLELKNPVYFT